MKGPKLAIFAKIPLCGSLILALAFLSISLRSQAQVLLTDHNSSASINPFNQSGMYNWSVDGVNQLYQQWFWYRIGLNPEQSIDTIGGLSITQPNTNTVYLTYNNGAYSVEVDYALTGQSPGSGQANIRESIRIHNFTDSSLDFHFFQYSDFDLNNDPNCDTVQLC